MDGTLTEFFNEIDKIAPKKEFEIAPRKQDKTEQVWQKCFDNSTGYSYYWNVKTDEVTWEKPKDFKEEESLKLSKTNITPLFPSTAISRPKVYNILDDATTILVNKRSDRCDKKNNVDTKERKVVMLTSYDNSDSETEAVERTVKIIEEKPQGDLTTVLTNKIKKASSKPNSCNTSDNEDETDLLKTIQSRVEILKNLEGEVPPDIRKLNEISSAKKKFTKKQKQDVTGFSLVSYGESDDEEDEDLVASPSLDEDKSQIPSLSSDVASGHSILFPIPKPIDIEQFVEKPKEEEPQEIIDTRAFQRKRRIGVDLIKNTKIAKHQDDTARLGLGFKSENESLEDKKESKTEYLGFKSGGTIFTKSEALNSEISKKDESDESKSENLKTIEVTRKTLSEKLNFLSEGREPASPVQIMLIQMETLYIAMQEGSLTAKYLSKWLTDTCAELINLESDAAPSGWLLQWDRINKRYYYRNRQSGKSQWEYPQTDVSGEDDAMDISTTPPPPGDDILTENISCVEVQPPPPPRIRSPTPPPPPLITEQKKKKEKVNKSTRLSPEILDIKIPPNEPLPPGVDSIEVTSQKEEKLPENDALGSALNSFYSDLAALETDVPKPTPAIAVDNKVTETPQLVEIIPEEVTKKKKRPKVKIVQGLAMKKKGVSKLVEKWKNVQKDYN